jgi:hypothetical protein
LENFLVLIKNFWQRERYNKAWIKIVQDCWENIVKNENWLSMILEKYVNVLSTWSEFSLNRSDSWIKRYGPIFFEEKDFHLIWFEKSINFLEIGDKIISIEASYKFRIASDIEFSYIWNRKENKILSIK